jgi:DNA invertase Pin-like site-specific DNA recombinase
MRHEGWEALPSRYEANGVGFVSTTQQFNTRDAMGRLTLNLAVSFARFEPAITRGCSREADPGVPEGPVFATRAQRAGAG